MNPLCTKHPVLMHAPITSLSYDILTSTLSISIGGLLKKRIVLAINRYIVFLYTNQVFMTYSNGCEAAPVAVCIQPLVLRTNPMFIQPHPILIIL